MDVTVRADVVEEAFFLFFSSPPSSFLLSSFELQLTHVPLATVFMYTTSNSHST